MDKKLFPTDLPELKWVEFPAAGFVQPVSGLINRTDKPPCCGVPLGGIGTGCLDMDAHGVYGFSTVFNPVSAQRDWADSNPDQKITSARTARGSLVPRKLPRPEPLLGLAAEGKTWVLVSQEFIDGGDIPWCTEPQDHVGRDLKPKQNFVRCPKIEGVQAAKEIHYWGHYPIADMEFETDAPISVGMRAWAPFIPGDVATSNIPAIVFEVHLRNTSPVDQQGTVAFNFPGPDVQEAMVTEFTRHRIDEDFHGVLVSSLGDVSYILSIIGDEEVRLGGGLNRRQESWSGIATELPQPTHRESQGVKLYADSSASAAVDFTLPPGEQKTVRFLLAWYAPVWEGGAIEQSGSIRNAGSPYMKDRWTASKWAGTQNTFTHMYAARYDGALDIARRMAVEHESLLARVIAWQSALYTDKGLPVWLRDSLVNNLALLAEDSIWVQAKPPLGDWAFPGGAFAIQESPRGCPQTSVLPNDWLATYPIVFFFPELALSHLRSFKAYQLEDGEAPFRLGMQGDLPDITCPGYYWQVSENGVKYADMVDRLWQRTGNDEILREFYDSVRKSTTFTMNLCKEGPGSIISIADRGGSLGMEHCRWEGMCGILGGERLAQLSIVKRMAEHMGDTEYAEQCRKWYKSGSKALEEEMWTGTHYLNFYDKATGEKSDEVLVHMLDGQWIVRMHGLEGVFQPDRVQTTLETFKRCNFVIAPEVGPVLFTRPKGNMLPSISTFSHNISKDGNPPGVEMNDKQGLTAYGHQAVYISGSLLVAMTYMYEGQAGFGLEQARRAWKNILIRQRHPWDHPNFLRADTGQRVYGTDYSQGLMLWALPVAIAQEDVATHCKIGGLVDRIIQAGKEK